MSVAVGSKFEGVILGLDLHHGRRGMLVMESLYCLATEKGAGGTLRAKTHQPFPPRVSVAFP